MFCALLGQDIRRAFTGPMVLLFEFCTLQFCKCDISESVIGRGLKLLSACRVQ